MRIVIDARYMARNFSGIGVYSEYLLENLSLLDRENEYFCFVRNDYSRKPDLGDNFELIPCQAPPLSYYSVLGFHRKVERLKPDFLHSLFPIIPVLYNGKLLVTVHDLQPLLMREWTGKRFYPIKKMYDLFYHWMYPAVFNRANWLIADSQATKDSITAIDPELAHKAIVIHPGISQDCFTEPDQAFFNSLKSNHALSDRYILYVGSTRPNKNIPRMLAAFARLLKGDPGFCDIQFVMVLTPDRFLTDVRAAIAHHKLGKNVKILEPVTDIEKNALYRNASLLFFATKHEGFGFPVLEAQAQGCPVVAANHASLPEVSGGSALLSDPDNEADMAECLRRALQDENLRQTLVQAGAENVKRFFWTDTARKVMEIYYHLM